jgi:hypothetical protein
VKRALLVFLLVGCGNDLTPASVVTNTRMVGARVEVDGFPNLSMPRAGEAITVRWFVVYPDAPTPVSASLVSCLPLPGTSGIPACQPGTIQPLAFREPSTEPFITHLVAPDAASLGGAREFLVAGALCGYGGTVDLAQAQNSLTCVGGSEPEQAQRFALRVSIAPDGSMGNQNPELRGGWTLGGSDWPEASAEGACGDALPYSASSGPVEITIAWTDSDRETYLDADDDPTMSSQVREPLLLSHFANAGKLSRTGTAVDETTPGNPISFTWTPPTVDPSAEDRLVRISTVARDGRGGAALAERVLCLKP